MVEQRSPKPRVVSSSLAAPAKNILYMKIRRRHIAIKILLSLTVLLVIILSAIFIKVDIIKNENAEYFPDMRETYCAEYDDLPPSIELIGDAEITLTRGEEYIEPGTTVEDYCEVASTWIDGDVDTNVPGEYTVSYYAKDASANEAHVSRKVTIRPVSNGTIFLTFDDGPGAYTGELLDILAKYNVKATFFVTGAGADELILREHNEGHTVALHTLTHNYAQIYQNVDTYFADLYAVQARVKNITGEDATLIRFPGGSSNLVSAYYDGGAHLMSQLTEEVERRGFTYFDWNISSGDAGGATSSDQVYNNVVSQLKVGGSSVVLQHDIKGFSVAAVERIIQYGLANGFTFERLTAGSFTAHHGVNN